MDQGYAGVGRGLYVSATNFPDKTAIVEVDGISLTYRDFNRSVNKLAHYLLRFGMHKGDHLAILSSNCIEHVICLYAAAKLGVVAIALDPRWTEVEVERALGFFDCKVAIIDKRLSDKISAAAALCVPLGVITFDKKYPLRCDLIDMISAMSEEEPGVEVFDHDIFTMILTSGTTGMPKGCMRSHRNVEIGCIKDVMGKRLDNSSQELVVVPIYYGTGRGSVISQIYLGGTVHIMQYFDAGIVACYITENKISAIALAPTMCMRILKLPDLDSYDFSSIKALRKAGSPFSTPVLKEVLGKITKNIYQGFASTESGGVTMLKPNDQLTKIGSSGLPRWGVQLQIVNVDGAVIPRGEDGEICVRGANVCQGYYKNPDEQNKAFVNGWYYTGDIGRLDDDGYLYVVGRIKDVIKTGSINVSPREIENVVLSCEGVYDVAVVGVPDSEWGEIVKAIVVREDGSDVTAEEILIECRRSLANFKVPKALSFATHIERNELGKVTSNFKLAAKEGRL